MKDLYLEPSDFNLEKKYETFDVIYSLSKKPTDNEVKAWIVIGHVLENSSEYRCLKYELCSYPIHSWITSNTKLKLNELRDDFISMHRDEVIADKKALLSEFFSKELSKLT